MISAYIATAVSAHCRRDYSVTGVTSGNTVHATRGSQEQNTDVLKLKGNSSGNVPNVPGMTSQCLRQIQMIPLYQRQMMLHFTSLLLTTVLYQLQMT